VTVGRKHGNAYHDALLLKQHRIHRGIVQICNMTQRFMCVRTASSLRHVPPGLPAFFYHPCAVYIHTHGFSHSHTVFCTPHRHREGG
jgi:hypothetical protein